MVLNIPKVYRHHHITSKSDLDDKSELLSLNLEGKNKSKGYEWGVLAAGDGRHQVFILRERKLFGGIIQCQHKRKLY